jgi:hypothetical protein
MSIEAMKQALDALEYIENNYMSLPAPAIKAIAALRLAIEQAETKKFPGEWIDEMAEVPPDAWEREKQAERQEPVAWMWQHSETGRTRIVMPDSVITADANWIVVGPLYLGAAPPQRQPLTDAERNHLWETIYDHGNGKYQGEQSHAQRARAFEILKRIGGEHD